MHLNGDVTDVESRKISSTTFQSHYASPLQCSVPSAQSKSIYTNGVYGSYKSVPADKETPLNKGVSATWAANIMPTPPDSPPPESHHKGHVNDATTKYGLRNLLKVPTSNSNNYFLTRQCCYIFYCSRIKVYCNYPKLTYKSVLEDARVEEAMEKVVSEDMEDAELEAGTNAEMYKALVSKYKKQAVITLKKMRAALSSTLIRLTGYVLFKVFNFLFMSVTVTEGQLQMIEAASKRNIPLIFVPLHRSHVDYLFVTWILFNREIPTPIVAAGDNLRMPIFGWLLRGLGGFFIKRRLETSKSRKDYVYRAILQTYMTQALHAGYNLEFFIEGGRTRTGKPCLPKGGLLSVIINAFVTGTLDDALIVPIAINYDRILDGHFIQEQLGQKKVPESFWRAVRAIAKALSTSFGHSRIDFSQPFSLREFFQTRKNFPSEYPNSVVSPSDGPIVNGHQRSLSIPSNPAGIHVNGHLHATRSNSSLFGSEVSEEYRILIKSLASHIVYDAERCQAIMSTNAVAWLISYKYREGTTLKNLSSELQLLQEDLRNKGRDTGFSGDPLHVTIHAINMLGSSLVNVKGDIRNDDPSCVFVRPIVVLPNVIELSYYANALSPLYAIDAIVATSLITLSDCDLWSYKDVNTDFIISQNKLVERSKRLCEILSNEFVFVPPCGSLDAKIYDSVHNLVISGLLVSDTKPLRSRRYTDDSSDDDDSTTFADSFYRLHPTSANLEKISPCTRGLSSLIESYYATTLQLNFLIGNPCVDTEFVNKVQNSISELLKKMVLVYGESIAADPIRNAVKILEASGILESYSQDGLKVIFLHEGFESEERLRVLQEEMKSYRV